MSRIPYMRSLESIRAEVREKHAEHREVADKRDDDLRNEFAKIALAKGIEKGLILEGELGGFCSDCWAIADAMMATRKGGAR